MLINRLDEHIAPSCVRIHIAVLVEFRRKDRECLIPLRRHTDFDFIAHVVDREGIPVEIQLCPVSFYEKVLHIGDNTVERFGCSLAVLVVVRDTHALNNRSACVEEDVIERLIAHVVDVDVCPYTVKRDVKERNQRPFLRLSHCEITRAHRPCFCVMQLCGSTRRIREINRVEKEMSYVGERKTAGMILRRSL